MAAGKLDLNKRRQKMYVCHSLSNPFNTELVFVFFCFDCMLLCIIFVFYLIFCLFIVLFMRFRVVYICVFLWFLLLYKWLSGPSVVDFK